MKITITDYPRSGKTTLAVLIAQGLRQLGFKKISITDSSMCSRVLSNLIIDKDKVLTDDVLNKSVTIEVQNKTFEENLQDNNANYKARQRIYKILDGERDYQDERWGTDPNRNHEIASWILYMEDYLKEAKTIASRNEDETLALDALRKVVALGVKCFEVHGVSERKK
jgi:hypothetical protein